MINFPQKITLKIAFLLFISYIGYSQNIPSDNPLKSKMDSLVNNYAQELMTKNPKVGVSIGVVQKGKSFKLGIRDNPKMSKTGNPPVEEV
jgi:hypothetical protein